MNALAEKDTVRITTRHYIDGAFVESHGREVMDIIRPTDGQRIAQVLLGDEEDTRRAIAAAKRAFATYGTSKPEERAEILRRLHRAASARIDELTDAMVEEYGGVVQFARPIVESSVNAFVAAEKALRKPMPVDLQVMGPEDDRDPGTGRGGRLDHGLERQRAVHVPQVRSPAVAAVSCTVVIKPSEMSSLQARVLVEALHEADLPHGLLNVCYEASATRWALNSCVIRTWPRFRSRARLRWANRSCAIAPQR